MEITNQMAPATTVENIKHLLVTTSDHGISNYKTFLVDCEEFDYILDRTWY